MFHHCRVSSPSFLSLQIAIISLSSPKSIQCKPTPHQQQIMQIYTHLTQPYQNLHTTNNNHINNIYKRSHSPQDDVNPIQY